MPAMKDTDEKKVDLFCQNQKRGAESIVVDRGVKLRTEL